MEPSDPAGGGAAVRAGGGGRTGTQPVRSSTRILKRPKRDFSPPSSPPKKSSNYIRGFFSVLLSSGWIFLVRPPIYVSILAVKTRWLPKSVMGISDIEEVVKRR